MPTNISGIIYDPDEIPVGAGELIRACTDPGENVREVYTQAGGTYSFTNYPATGTVWIDIVTPGTYYTSNGGGVYIPPESGPIAKDLRLEWAGVALILKIYDADTDGLPIAIPTVRMTNLTQQLGQVMDPESGPSQDGDRYSVFFDLVASRYSLRIECAGYETLIIDPYEVYAEPIIGGIAPPIGIHKTSAPAPTTVLATPEVTRNLYANIHNVRFRCIDSGS